MFGSLLAQTAQLFYIRPNRHTSFNHTGTKNQNANIAPLFAQWPLQSSPLGNTSAEANKSKNRKTPIRIKPAVERRLGEAPK